MKLSKYTLTTPRSEVIYAAEINLRAQGIRVENTNCTGFENSVAQAPDGLFLSCQASSGESLWVRGDNS